MKKGLFFYYLLNGAIFPAIICHQHKQENSRDERPAYFLWPMCHIQGSFIFSFEPLKIGLIVFMFSFFK